MNLNVGKVKLQLHCCRKSEATEETQAVHGNLGEHSFIFTGGLLPQRLSTQQG